MGGVRIGGRQSRELALSNTGELDLRIDAILSGTRQLILTPRSSRVPADETRTVRIGFAPATLGDIAGQLTLFTNDPARPQWVIPFLGRGVSRRLEVSAVGHDFGALSGSARWAVAITNHHNRRMRLLDVATDHRAFRIDKYPRHIAAGATDSIVVEFRAQPTASEGQLLLRTDLLEAPEVAVTFRGRALTAGRLQFGPVDREVALWPHESLQIPVQISQAARMRGIIFTVESVTGFTFEAFELPAESLLPAGGEALVLADADESGVQLGLALAGDVGGSLNGDGQLGVLRLQSAGSSAVPLPRVVTLRFTQAVARSFAGRDDTLTTFNPLEIRLRWKGDINGDRRFYIADAFALFEALSDGSEAIADRLRYDLNEDGIVDAADMQTLAQHLPAAAKAVGSWTTALLSKPSLKMPFPNPFNAETVVVVTLPATSTWNCRSTNCSVNVSESCALRRWHRESIALCGMVSTTAAMPPAPERTSLSSIVGSPVGLTERCSGCNCCVEPSLTRIMGKGYFPACFFLSLATP